MNKCTVEMIPTQAWGISCVGVSTPYPRGGGNYMSVRQDKTWPLYSIVNLSYEDMEDAKRLGVIGDTMKADVYYVDEKHRVAFVTDERLPAICLEPEWWYEKRNAFSTTILRKKYQVPEDTCLCKHEPSLKAAVFITYGQRERGFGRCRECNEMHIFNYTEAGVVIECGETAEKKHADLLLENKRKYRPWEL